MPRQVADMALDCHHVVEASAGTGKTYLIVHRIVDLLLRGELPLEQILVVTFTEKATAELRGRVRQLLRQVAAPDGPAAEPGQPCWQVDEAARARLGDALLSIDRATISTIHGFCHRVLTDNAFSGGRLFGEEQIAAELAFDDAFTTCLRERFAVDPEERALLAAWIDSDRKLGSLRKLLWECSARGGELICGDGAALADAAEVLSRPDLEEVLAAGFKNKRTREAVLKRVRIVAEAASLAAGGDLPAALAALREVGDYLTKEPRIAATPEAQHLVDTAVAAAGSASLDAIIAARFLPPIRERLRADKRRRGLFDFGDMLQLVWEALEGPDGPRLAETLRRRYPRALIDEFQDTDPVQWQIFERLYLEAPRGTATLSIIGDPKQAIYGFRGADLHTYLAARREVVAAGGQRTDLAVNFRSSAELVAAYNGLLTEGEPFFSGGVDYDNPVSAGAQVRLEDESGRPLTPVHLFRIAGCKGKEATALVGAGIAREVEALLASPPRLVTEDGARELGAGDIFVLTRAVREANDIAAALRARGVPCALFKQEGLLQTREAEELRDLLGAIADPGSPAARLRAWMTRFFALELTELSDLRELDDDHPLVAPLYEWHRIAQRLDYEELFPRLLAESRIVERELFASPSERALTNFLHLFELLLEDIAGDRCEIHELALRLQRWIDDVEGEGSGERNLQRLESEDDAVQIMTIHKAKGLEAPVVFATGGFSSGGSSSVHSLHRGGERLLWIGKAPPEIDELVRAEARSENERLLYVALTRAVGRLYLPCLDPEAVSERGAYALLNQRLGEDLCRAQPELFSMEEVEHQAPPAPEELAASLGDWEPPAALTAASPVRERREEARRRAGVPVTSYSRLAAGADDHGDTGDGAARAAAPADDADLPGGREVGIFLHELLERMPLSAARDAADFPAFAAAPEVEALVADCLRRHGIDERHRERSLQLCWDALTRPVDLGGGASVTIAAVEREIRELEFLYPLADAGGEQALVKGFIDLVFEHEGRLYVLDWKSDRLADYDPAALGEHVSAHYRTQALLYATAVERLIAAEGRDMADRFGAVVFSFLRGPAAHVLRPSAAELAAFSAEIAGAAAKGERA